MSTQSLTIKNLASNPLAINTRLAPGRQIQGKISPLESLEVGTAHPFASVEELNANAELLALRAAGKIAIIKAEGADDLAAIEALPIGRYSLAADSTLQASVIGSATEAIHTAITLKASDIGTARRLIRFKAIAVVTGANSTDTWALGVRLGGLAGTSVATIAAYDITAADRLYVEGEIQIRTLGTSGTFDAHVRTFRTGGTWTIAHVAGGAVNTTIDNTLVVTGTCSTNNSGNTVALRIFEVDILPA